jgi:adenosyl cobinamide kinase/adenosyl cobinamide phosphate guanylyltransferase
VIDDTDGWHGDIDAAAKRVDELVHAWRHTRARVVAVSNEVGWGVVPATASGRMFRDLHGRMNAAVAAASDRVTLVVAGRPMVIGGPPEPADLATDHPAEEQSP